MSANLTAIKVKNAVSKIRGSEPGYRIPSDAYQSIQHFTILLRRSSLPNLERVLKRIGVERVGRSRSIYSSDPQFAAVTRIRVYLKVCKDGIQVDIFGPSGRSTSE